MGSAFSSVTASQVVFAALICGALAYRHHLKNPAIRQSASEAVSSGDPSLSGSAGGGRKKKGKKGTSAGAEDAVAVEGVKPTVVAFPRVVPGDFAAPSDADHTEGGSASASEPATKTKKAKKKKSKAPAPVVTDAPAAATPSSGEPEKSAASAAAARSSKGSKSSTPSGAAAATKKNEPKDQQLPPQAYDTDSSWTRVEPSHAKSKRAKSGDGSNPQLGVATDFTTSDTGASGASGAGDSPVTERTDEEFPAIGTSSGVSSDNRRTFAEKMLPKPRKTGVDDMLEQSDYPTIARVMKVKPRPGEQPPAGFSWQDFEDVDSASNTGGGGQNDGDAGDDEGEWGVVKSKSRAKPSREASTSSGAAGQKASETMTKKQRQNATRREAEKAAKADQEAERLARQAKHKRDLERERIIAQAHKSGGARGVSGGMSASVDSQGKLVFD